MQDRENSPQGTLAILLGASDWPGSPKLGSSKSFSNSANEIRAYLLDTEGLALPAENVLDVFDTEKSPVDIAVSISQFLERRLLALKSSGIISHDLYVYYIGHGGFTGKSHEYYLAIRSTREDLEGISSLRVTDLARVILDHARGLRRYIILDCCFAASAFMEFQSPPALVAGEKTLALFPERGTALLCSSGAGDASINPIGESYTMFSGALLEVLRQGDADFGPTLSLSEVSYLVSRLLRKRYPTGFVTPNVLSPDQRDGDIADIPIFPNAFHRKTPFVAMASLNSVVGDLTDHLTHEVVPKTALDDVNSLDTISRKGVRFGYLCARIALIIVLIPFAIILLPAIAGFFLVRAVRGNALLVIIAFVPVLLLNIWWDTTLLGWLPGRQLLDFLESDVTHYKLGVSLADKGEYEAAIAEYKEAIRLKPDNAEAHTDLGVALYHKGEYDAAIAEYKEAIRLDPNIAEAHTDLGIALDEKGQHNDAIAEYRQAIRLKPDDAEAHYKLGTALAAEGKYNTAIVEFREAIRLKPGYSEAHGNLGAALDGKGQYDAAIAEDREAIRLKPDAVTSHYNLGNALADKGQYDDAIAEYKEAIRLKPDNAEAHYYLGVALKKTGKSAHASKEFTEAHRLDPRIAPLD